MHFHSCRFRVFYRHNNKPHSAAQLGTTLDGLRSQLQWVTRDARAAEDALEQAAARRLAVQVEGAALLGGAVEAARGVLDAQARRATDDCKARSKVRGRDCIE